MPQALLPPGLDLNNRPHLLFSCLITGRGTNDLESIWHIDHQYTLDLAILPGFYKQRRHHDGVRRRRCRQVLRYLGANQRMQQALEPLALSRIRKYPLTQRSTIQAALWQQYGIAEMLSNLPQRRATRLNDPTRRFIGIDYMHAKTCKLVCHCSLATANTAGQPENPRLHPSNIPGQIRRAQ